MIFGGERDGDDPIDMIFLKIAAHPARPCLPEGVSPVGASNGRGTSSDILAASGHRGRPASTYRPTCVHVVGRCLGASLRVLGRDEAS
ncbi:hypothetical protein CGRA01v4_04054 [Colletotrichum graminicola]|nr:hypothetical protein CGRA01v4_04054 [Colletotrichum graminicola]